MKIGFARVALFMAVLCSFTPKSAQAAVIHPASDPIVVINGNNVKNFDWSTAPPYSPPNSWFSNDAHADIGPQSPSNVKSVLQTPLWLGVPLAFVSGGSCSNAAVDCDPSTKSGTWTASGSGATVFGIHFGDNFIALLFAAQVQVFSIFNLPHGVSNIYAFTVTPVPGALWLMLSAITGWLGLTRWARRDV